MSFISTAAQGKFDRWKLLMDGIQKGVDYNTMFKPGGTEEERQRRANSDIASQEAQRAALAASTANDAAKLNLTSQGLAQEARIANAKINADATSDANRNALAQAGLDQNVTLDARKNAIIQQTASDQLSMDKAKMDADSPYKAASTQKLLQEVAVAKTQQDLNARLSNVKSTDALTGAGNGYITDPVTGGMFRQTGTGFEAVDPMEIRKQALLEENAKLDRSDKDLANKIAISKEERELNKDAKAVSEKESTLAEARKSVIDSNKGTQVQLDVLWGDNGWRTGVSVLNPFNNILAVPGMDAADFKGALAGLSSKVKQMGAAAAKDAGASGINTVAEMEMAGDAIANLSTAQSDDQFRNVGLATVQKLLNRGTIRGVLGIRAGEETNTTIDENSFNNILQEAGNPPKGSPQYKLLVDTIVELGFK